MQYAIRKKTFSRSNKMTAETPRLVIAMGDPAGISPELLAKLLSQTTFSLGRRSR
jgi:hypothetical protein